MEWLKFCTFIFLIIFCLTGYSQNGKGNLKGKVIDGISHRTLFGVSVSAGKDPKGETITFPDGGYILSLNKGEYAVSFTLKGFQSKIISKVIVQEGQVSYLDIILFPVTQREVVSHERFSSKDSLPGIDSVFRNKYITETYSVIYSPASYIDLLNGDIIRPGNIVAGNFRSGAQVLKGLNGVVLQDFPFNRDVQSFTISGMGERYNQLLLNGSVFSYFDPLSRSFPVELIPTEAIEEVNVQKTGNASIPSDFAGGSVGIKTKDFTDNRFIYLLAGTGYDEGTRGKIFYGDSRNNSEYLSFSGSQRDLPAEFPTTRSPYPLSSKNIQEQVFLSKLLKNNIAPYNYGNAKPDSRIMMGFGNGYKLKSGARISLIGFVTQNKTEQFNESLIQTAPNISENPYPFVAANKSVVYSQSKDFRYNYSSQLSAIINGSIIYGKNKISFRNFLGSQFSNTYTQRLGIYKPGEDSLAHSGVQYITTQRYFINSQLSGDHALGSGGRLKMEWQATYSFIKQQNPDERNFLLRQEITATDKYELATPYDPKAFTNSGRLWRNFKDNNFSATFDLSFPFNMLHRSHVLAGGVYIQQNYRIFNSDLFLVQGKGYYTIDNLLAPERYYPGGLSVTNYYSNDIPGATNLQPIYRANYSASSNLGASFIQFDSHLSGRLLLRLGTRVESNSLLASNIQYRYFAGYKNPQIAPIDENTRIIKTSLLPSINLIYSPTKKIKLHAAYYKTVNRPQLQEVVRYSYYEAATFMIKTGNPLLATALISNYTAGLNFLNNAFSSISILAFYKKIDQPIETIVSEYSKGILLATPHNTPSAEIKGLEASFKLRLNFVRSPWLSSISVFANGNLLQSKAKAGPIRSAITASVADHRLSGTPDYSFNAGLTIQEPRFPGFTILYSRTADYITSLGSGQVYSLSNGNTVSAIPDYRVKGREQLDILVSQKIFKKRMQIIAGVNNLIADSFVIYQDLNGNKKFDGPLVLDNRGGNGGGYYVSGTDNTILNHNQQRIYYVTLSFLFR